MRCSEGCASAVGNRIASGESDESKVFAYKSVEKRGFEEKVGTTFNVSEEKESRDLFFPFEEDRENMKCKG